MVLKRTTWNGPHKLQSNEKQYIKAMHSLQTYFFLYKDYCDSNADIRRGITVAQTPIYIWVLM
jgi:hypothetical protein